MELGLSKVWVYASREARCPLVLGVIRYRVKALPTLPLVSSLVVIVTTAYSLLLGFWLQLNPVITYSPLILNRFLTHYVIFFIVFLVIFFIVHQRLHGLSTIWVLSWLLSLAGLPWNIHDPLLLVNGIEERDNDCGEWQKGSQKGGAELVKRIEPSPCAIADIHFTLVDRAVGVYWYTRNDWKYYDTIRCVYLGALL